MAPNNPEEKQHAFHRWSRNRSGELWNVYTRLRDSAATVYATAQEDYNRHLRDSLGNITRPHKWWSTLNASLCGIESALPPLLGTDGGLEFEPGGKAELLSSTFTVTRKSIGYITFSSYLKLECEILSNFRPVYY